MAKESTKPQKSPEKAGKKDKGKKKHFTPVKSTKLLTDSKLEDLNQKWSEHFSRLEVFLISKSLEKPSQEPTFQTVKMPVKRPPASAVKSTKPFLALTQPADQPLPADQDQHGDPPQPAQHHQSTNQPSTNKASTLQ